MDIESNKVQFAMMVAGLTGNEMKVMTIYLSLGGWKHGTEVFLPESVKNAAHLADSTVKRARKVLVKGGWLKPTGNTSRFNCDYYTCHIPSEYANVKPHWGEYLKGIKEVGQNDPPRSVKMTHGVGQNDLPGSVKMTYRSNKEEVTKEVPKKETKVAPEALRSSGKPSSPTSSLNKNDKDARDVEPSLIGPNVPAPAASPIEPTKTGEVGQNDLPHSATQNDLTDEERRKLHFGDPRWLPPLQAAEQKKELAW